MLCLTGFELYSRWVPLRSLTWVAFGAFENYSVHTLIKVYDLILKPVQVANKVRFYSFAKL